MTSLLSFWILFAIPWWLVVLSSFSLSFGHFYLILWKVTIHDLSPLINCVAGGVVVQLLEFFPEPGYYSFITSIFCSYLLWFCWLSFALLIVTFAVQTFLSLMESHLSIFFFFLVFLYFKGLFQEIFALPMIFWIFPKFSFSNLMISGSRFRSLDVDQVHF